MKLVSFVCNGRPSFGILHDGGIVDVGARCSGRFVDLAGALANVGALESHADDSVDWGLNDVTLLPPVPNPRRIVCVGLNYKSHIAETGRDMPQYPMLFPRYPETLVGHGAPLVRPSVSDQFDFEGEMAFVIGKPGRSIPRERALEHVAGYACLNDGSIRDFQSHTSQFMPGKNFEASGSFGPWLVTPDEIGDISAQRIETRLNGEVVQRAGLNDLLFTVEDLIEYISTIWTLQPGDVVATGTTGGVGKFRKPPLWMKPGDTVEVSISGIGTLSNPVRGDGQAH